MPDFRFHSFRFCKFRITYFADCPHPIVSGSMSELPFSDFRIISFNILGQTVDTFKCCCSICWLPEWIILVFMFDLQVFNFRLQVFDFRLAKKHSGCHPGSFVAWTRKIIQSSTPRDPFWIILSVPARGWRLMACLSWPFRVFEDCPFKPTFSHIWGCGTSRPL